MHALMLAQAVLIVNAHTHLSVLAELLLEAMVMAAMLTIQTTATRRGPRPLMHAAVLAPAVLIAGAHNHRTPWP